MDQDKAQQSIDTLSEKVNGVVRSVRVSCSPENDYRGEKDYRSVFGVQEIECLYVDTEGKQLVADGSDFIVVVAEVTDDSGNVRRLAKENIVFTVEGEGRVIGDASINANPRTVEFGSAPVLIRSTRKPGKIKVKAHVQFEGTNAPVATEIELESIPSELPFCYTEEETDAQSAGAGLAGSPVRTERMAGKVVLTEEERQKVLMEVERQQTEFGTEK